MPSERTAALIVILCGIWISTILVLVLGGVSYFWLIFAAFGISIAVASIFVPSIKANQELAIECAKKGEYARPDGLGCQKDPPS